MEKIRYERPLIKRLENEMPNKFGGKTERKPLTHIDGVAVKALIEEYGSPLFVISEKTIRILTAKQKRFYAALSQSSVCLVV
jgi:diaminopimelate decarboxylase